MDARVAATSSLRWALHIATQRLAGMLGTLLLSLAPAGAVLAQGPTVTALSPTRNAVTAARATPVAVTFSGTIDAATGNNLTVYSSQAGGKKAGVYTTNGSTVTFDPTTDFKPGETVFATIPATLKGTNGAGVSKQVFQFTTATGGGGKGTFSGNLNVGVGSNPRNSVLADVNGDGSLDLLTANAGSGTGDRPGTVNVRFNDGAGTFSTTHQNVAVGKVPYYVATGDVDGDGDLDLLCANGGNSSQTASSTVSVRLNDGSGTFTDTGQNVSVSNDPASMVLGDIDGDGDLDLIVANNSGSSLSVRLNKGNGDFEENRQELSTGNQVRVVAIGDIDGDGDLDLLATSNSQNRVSTHLNGGDATGSNTGVFTRGQDVTVGTRPQGLAVSDVDGDGDLDILAANNGNPGNSSSSTVSVRLNDSNGNFSGSQEVLVGSTPQSVTVGDVDADGDLDLLTANNDPNGTVSVRLNDGTGNFDGNQDVTVGLDSRSVAVGDLDNDGDLDFVTANFLSGSSSVRLNQDQAQVPTITSVSPAAELPGMPVTITGTNFTNNSTVSFGGVPASSVTLNSSSSLTAIVPAGAAVGNSPVVVTNSPGNDASNPAFNVLKVFDGTTSCLTSNTINATGDGAWHYLFTAEGDVIAAIQDTRNSLVTVAVGLQVIESSTPVRQDGRNHYYLDRNFVVTARNGNFPNQTINMRFYGLNSEMARLQTVDPAVSYSNLKVTQYSSENNDEDCDFENNDFIYGNSVVLAAPASTPGNDVPWFVAEVAVADHFSEFYLTGSSRPLPVELTSFTAEQRNTSVQLRWRTASEQNSARFEVERSRDGRTFQPIGQVAAQGTSTRPSDYTFDDATYPTDVALLYYRLRQVDQDGTATYSPVRTVALGDVARTLRVYPNPAHSQLTVAGVAPGAVVEVFDATGRRVMRITADENGSKELRLPDGLPAGVYLVRSGAQSSRLAVQ
ncbi:FG-GAP-like repeat-containing protein [Hymenobacter sp. YC55]|uniref:FG-GAP-like repeat-containing protein n=1 Tax=Hymenobacter sp. YC55 TaxID=3034019 RepID=UPI0023F7C1B3|nr:FG-GAP-like repeat-containing protein [Hymenobacter sp. YC55]MDF7810827.1 FG-GAP-like repeat-containing protein [Hymenobacter sp. YC55]